MSSEIEQGLPAEITLYVQTPEGFDAQVKVLGVETNGITTWLKGASARLKAAGFVTSSVAERNHVATAAAKEATEQNGGAGPVCAVCAGPTEFKSGNGKKGPWSGWFCIRTKDAPTAQRHTPIWKN